MRTAIKTYSDKIKDPRWQKLRLKVFARDEFKCTCCGENMETINAHHIAYKPNTEPWEYDISEITTFCDQCHKYEHQLQTLSKIGIHLDSAGI